MRKLTMCVTCAEKKMYSGNAIKPSGRPLTAGRYYAGADLSRWAYIQLCVVPVLRMRY